MHDRPTDRPGAQTIADAAAQLGISQNAVRMRIRRGTLSGFKSEDGRWYVHTTDQVHNETDQATSAPTDHAITTARTQLDMIRDEWLLPLVDQIRGLERETGRLEAERDEARREADELRRQLEDLTAARAAQDAPESPETSDQQEDDQRPRRAWWKFWSG